MKVKPYRSNNRSFVLKKYYSIKIDSKFVEKNLKIRLLKSYDFKRRKIQTVDKKKIEKKYYFYPKTGYPVFGFQ